VGKQGLKALTITQPWASLMATLRPDGLPWKTIETRSWYTNYRGEMVIHAAKGFPRWAQWTCTDPVFAEALGGLEWRELPLSVGLCVVRVVGCIRTTELHKAEPILGRKLHMEELRFGNYSEGRWAWLTEYVRPLPNVGPVRGSLGLWNWAESDQARAERELCTGETHR